MGKKLSFLQSRALPAALSIALVFAMSGCKPEPVPGSSGAGSKSGSAQSAADSADPGGNESGGAETSDPAASGGASTSTGSKNTGGGGTASIPAANNEKVTLLVDMHGWMPTLNATPTAENPTVFRSPQAIADAFTKKHPNITIKWARSKPVGGTDEAVAQWFTTQINAGTVPAVAFSWGTQYQDRGWYLDLDTYLNQPNPYVSGNKKWKDLFPSYLWSLPTIASAQKKVVAIPVALYPGPATGYYYNKSALADAGVAGVPKTWEELVTASGKLTAKGYVGIGSWGFFHSVSADSWVAQYCLGPAVAGSIMDRVDYDKNSILDAAEQLRGVKAGLFSPVKNEYARVYYQQQKRYFTSVLPAGWESTDRTSLWNLGKLGMREEGLWALPNERNNKARQFDFDVFPMPLMSTDTSPYTAKVTYTEKGPYQPNPDLQLNIMKGAVGKPAMLDAAVKFLQFLTTPDNISAMILENGADIGAVLGTSVPPQMADWLSRPFPKVPKASWPMAFTSEQNLSLNRNFESWVKNQMSDAEFFKKVDELQAKGADDYIRNMKISTAGW